ncbi:peptide chain release factor N(5)-glutamine methyltransferase [Oceanomicrobium pacificus]|uniref:peptide chain release factor N(5)-glutamine methyltransferase n=1 Tax=Oceanomicrobium pacificus TaxID=2692916 RepID=UPI00136E2F9A|nr:peptide chain release factor N(5)-glutamine methyltransferase [Oceanomicrobium pacificus]
MSDRLADLLAHGQAVLTAAGITTAPRDARRLLAHAMKIDPARLTVELSGPAPAGLADRFGTMIAARARFQPVAQIIGYRDFWGRRFRVTQDVLDPRPDSETLIEALLEGGPAERLLDLGTGSGCLALTLLAEWPGAHGVATDQSAAALNLARENAEALGLTDRVRFAQGDWWDAADGTFDLILSNPPYIPTDVYATLDPDVRDWEPEAALTPGADGLAAYRAIIDGVADHLRPGGRLAFEIGYDQGASVAALVAERLGWTPRILPDLNGHDRVVLADRPA